MLNRVKRVHFVGIGGTGMCGIAEVMLNEGYVISGSDINTNAATERLASLGAKIFCGQHAEQVEDVDLVVTSTAVKEDNPEVIVAHAQRIPVVKRAEMLDRFSLIMDCSFTSLM